MFGLAYVLLPFSDVAPAEAIAASLARFRRGRRGELPDEWLRFFDHSDEVRRLHETTLTLSADRLVSIGGEDSWYLNMAAVREELARCGKEQWTVRLADVEPDIGRFAARFVRAMDRHPVTKGFGRWLNPLGEWDWWDLGGCYDGAITGMPKRRGKPASAITSGDCLGRRAFETLAGALEEACGQAPEPTLHLHSDDNIELVSTLLETLDSDAAPRLPSTVVRPPGCVDDEQRWISSWPELACSGPGAEWADDWRATVREAYDQHRDQWAAAIAYHF